MITTHEKIGVGYFDTVFAKIEIETMADALKSFALNYDLDETSSQGEVLNYFVSTLIKTIDLQNFKLIAPQLFTYSKTYQETVEVYPIKESKEELIYLQKYIDQLIYED
ncbi:hypothetical protein SPSF3K_01129 [Streptococcus parauberis]|nr:MULTISPECIES: hypothetical protein [Streptococcaceae]AUT05854.1 hypothetical protein SPSF3K_01129 [Streptococcus parauberis]UWV09293.1 hypothetical protein N2A95_05660 [Streptococcus parauberis]WOF47872.1 hypothetical protein K7G42_05055 [Streptococcus parauberis]